MALKVIFPETTYVYYNYFWNSLCPKFHVSSIILTIPGLITDYFFNSELFLVRFLPLLFHKRSNNFITIKITNNVCQQISIFNFFNHKNFFTPVWNVIFCKNVFNFDILLWSPTLNLGSSFSFSLLKSIYVLYISRLHFNCAMICIVVFIKYVSYFINIHIVWYWGHIFIDSVLSGFNKSSSNNRFPLIMCWIHFYIITL